MEHNPTEADTKLKKAEQALRASEERYRLLVEHANEAIVVAQDGLLKFFNPKALEITGYSEEELSVKPFLELVHPEDRALVARRHADRLMGRELPHVYPFRIVDKAGQTKWLQINAVLLEWQGAPATLNFLTDVTEQKRTEEALKESMEKYRILVENSGDIMLTLGPDLRLTYISPVAERLTGQTPEEIMKQSLDEMFVPSSAELLRNRFRRILAAEKSGVGSGDVERLELEHIHKNGSTVWGGLTLRPLRTPEGRFAGMIGVTRDITSRKRAEEALRESERRLQLALEGAQEGLWDWNILTGEFYFNPQWLEALGYAEHEIVPSVASWTGMVHPDDLPMVRRAFVDHFKGKTSFYDVEHRMRDKTGRWRWICARGTVVERDPQDTAVRMIGTCLDITERKRVEKEKQDMEAQLRQAQKMQAIGTLAGGVAHDFNNILTAVMGYTELAFDEIEEAHPARDKLKQVLNSALRAKGVVQQILSFSRRTDQERKPVLMAPIVQEVLALLRATLPSTIEINQKIEMGPWHVKADPTQIHQLLMNLSTNAAHAMREAGGRLDVKLEYVTLDEDAAKAYAELGPGRYQRLSVTDTGEGMDEETLGRIFEPFFTTKRTGEGTGMGLAVVHGIVQSHGGAIIAESEFGKGSTFHVYLPLIENEAGQEVSVQTPSLPRGTERILFVDDEQAIVHVGRQILERLGYEVTIRTSSIKALELFQANPDAFDLIITDQTMPGMTGIRLAQEMTKARPGVPIILYSGFGDQTATHRIQGCDIKRFLMKPLTAREIAEAVRQVLDTEKG